MFYIKKLGRQELESPKPDGTVARGRYMLISQKSEDFFPLLSETELNDVILIPIVSPETKEKIYCSYVYHNSKFHPDKFTEQPRNEFRIYLNSGIDPKRRYFQPNDIVVFQRIETDELIPIYEFFLFREPDENYSTLNNIVESSELRGGHALYKEELNFLPVSAYNENIATVIPDEVKRDVVKKQKEIEKDISNGELEETKGANLFNSVSFRDFVLLGYERKCAITETSISYSSLINLEAAHIKPKSHKGSFLPCNGIAMSRDIHWAFDKGMFYITDDYKVKVHEDVIDTLLGQYNDKMIFTPKEDFFKPEKRYLEHHRKNVFGLFKHSGMIKGIE